MIDFVEVFIRLVSEHDPVRCDRGIPARAAQVTTDCDLCRLRAAGAETWSATDEWSKHPRLVKMAERVVMRELRRAFTGRPEEVRPTSLTDG